MKTTLILFTLAFSLVSASAFAGARKLSPQSVEVLSVVAANTDAFAELSTFGNQVTSATVEQTSGEFTRFKVTVQNCQLQGCLGGATLTIERLRDLTPGLFPPYRYTTNIVHLR